MSPATRPRVLLGALAVLSLLAALLPGLPSAAAQSTGQLGVTLTATYTSATESRAQAPVQTGVAAGAVSSPNGSGSFTFEAGCAISCTNLKTEYDFGDGTQSAGDSNGVTGHAYRTPGRYTVTVRISATSGGEQASGQGRMLVLVGPRYADTELAVSGAPNPAREIARATGALKLLSPCGTASATAPALQQSFEKFSDGTSPQGEQGNQQLFCPEPNPYYGPIPPGSTTPPPSLGTNLNGVTGERCFEHWEYCGLPARVFAQANGGDPRGACNIACLNQLAALRLVQLAPAPRATSADPAQRYDLTYSPTNCLDGWKMVLQGGTWSLTQGTERGCVSRREFFSALTTALDGYVAGQNGLYRISGYCGSQGAVAPMERAAALGINAKRTRTGGPFCDSEQAVTKADAYRAVQAATGAAVDTSECATTETLRDLQDPTLADRADQEDDRCVPIGGMIDAGAPIAGSTTCPDGAGVCFNPDEALTRVQLGQLLGSQLSAAGRFAAASSVRLRATPSTNSAKVGETVNLRAVVEVPANFDPTNPNHKVTLTWPGTGTGASFKCANPQTKTIPLTRRVEFSCGYTQSTEGTASLEVNAVASTGTSTLPSNPDTVRISFGNDAPVFGGENMPRSAEDTPAEAQITAADSDSTNLSYTLSNAENGTFGETAVISVGVVSKVRVIPGQGVVVRMTPGADRNAPEYTFWIQVRDDLGGSAKRKVTGRILARNDEPVVVLRDEQGTRAAPIPVQLSGNDNRDTSQPTYPGCAPLRGFTFTAVPDGAALGVLEVDEGAGFQKAEANRKDGANRPALYPLNAAVRFRPSGQAGGTYQFSYTTTDVGFQENVDKGMVVPTDCTGTSGAPGSSLTSDAQPVTIRVQ